MINIGWNYFQIQRVPAREIMDVNINRIIRSKRKTIALIIEPDGRLVVRAPYLVSDRDIRKLVKSKQAWIKRSPCSWRILR